MEIVYNATELVRYVGLAMELNTGHPVLIDKYLQGARIYGRPVPDEYEPLMGKVSTTSLSELIKSSRQQLEDLPSKGIRSGVISFDAAGNMCEGVAMNPAQEYEFLRSSRSGPPGITDSIMRRARGDLQFNGIELEVAKLYRALKMAEVVSGEAE